MKISKTGIVTEKYNSLDDRGCSNHGVVKRELLNTLFDGHFQASDNFWLSESKDGQSLIAYQLGG